MTHHALLGDETSFVIQDGVQSQQDRMTYHMFLVPSRLLDSLFGVIRRLEVTRQAFEFV